MSKKNPRSQIEEALELKVRARRLRRDLQDIMGGSLETIESAFGKIENEYLFIKGRAAELEKTRPLNPLPRLKPGDSTAFI